MTRIATDIGGTFTDIVWVDDRDGQVNADKAPTTPGDVVDGVMAAYGKSAVPAADVNLFLHGSTVATNALVTQTGARTGLITTSGFRDILEIRRIDRPDDHIYNIFWEKPKPLAPRRLRLEVSARMKFNGVEMSPLVEEEVIEAIERLCDAGVESIAVCLLHAYANPEHELRIGEIIAERFPEIRVSLSHQVAREIREYERTSSTVIDAYVKKPVVGYLERLENALATDAGIESPPLIANSSGGVSTVAAISRAPIQMMESGPAGGAIGAAYLSEKLGIGNLVTGDVGGTSYDVSLVVNGKTHLRTEHEILGYAAKVSSIDVRSVGAGGGSIARVDSGGRLHVGPASAGAVPGPMCYGKGGSEPTVTDAAVVCGLIDPQRFAGGEIALNVDLARQGVAEIAKRLGLPIELAAEGILTIAQTNMANVTRQILVGQGWDPRDFSLLAFGGGGGLFAAGVARALDIPRVVIPIHPAMFSAWGMLNADIIGTFARSYLRRLDEVDPAVISGLYREMEAEAGEIMEEAGIPVERVTLQRSVDARYEGQGHEVEVALGCEPIDMHLGRAIAPLFDAAHELRFGHRMPNERETVTFRLRAFGSLNKLELPRLPAGTEPAPVRHREVFVAGEWRSCPVYDRTSLGASVELKGPAIVEEPSHITVLGTDDRLSVDTLGCLQVELG
jgi:N-methylhydantoinase A